MYSTYMILNYAAQDYAKVIHGATELQKLGPLDEYAGERALAWIDDSFDQSCFDWAQGRSAPTLLVPTEAPYGLEEAQTEALTKWAVDLAKHESEGG